MAQDIQITVQAGVIRVAYGGEVARRRCRTRDADSTLKGATK